MNQYEQKIVSIQNILQVLPDGIVGPKTHAALDALQTLASSEGGVITFSGKMSTFGGPNDTGVQPDEGLSVYGPDGNSWKLEYQTIRDPQGVFLFLPTQPVGTMGLARRLNPKAAYIAYRFAIPANLAILQKKVATLSANNQSIGALLVDWGPNINTGRVCDMSPGAANWLRLKTDDTVNVNIS